MRNITASRSTGLSIGRLSRLTSVNIETIRYYERIGIMPVPPRTPSGQRIYAEDHLSTSKAVEGHLDFHCSALAEFAARD
jgi:DNA-binding transcriptional MerR regulator